MKNSLFIAMATGLTFFSLAVEAAYMPSPTHAKGDRIRVKGESGIEIDAEYSPDMTVQFGTAYGKDLNNEYTRDQYHRHSDRERNEGSLYIQAVVPITFGDRKRPDAKRLYDMELQNRQLEIDRLQAEVALMKAALEAGATSREQIFTENAS